MTYKQQIAEAAEWRLIGLLLERPRAGWHDEVARLAAEVRDLELREAASAAASAGEGDYLASLGPGGAVSPREVTYQPWADPGHLLAQLAMLYDAFAFRPQVEEPLDHIAVEVAFVSYLLLKQAFAAARGDSEAAATTAAARDLFLESHLAYSAAPFAQRLAAAGATYLRAAAHRLAARVPDAPPVLLPGATLDAAGLCGGCEGLE